jgi:hypothetical protein
VQPKRAIRPLPFRSSYDAVAIAIQSAESRPLIGPKRCERLRPVPAQPPPRLPVKSSFCSLPDAVRA